MTEITHPHAPYKGLRYYKTEDAEIFAARDRDAGRCARLLTGRASVLMLHGRTGCGKSSFLRAALKPILERAGTGLWFPESGKQFSVVRSGLTPLREIAGAVFNLVKELKASPMHAARAPQLEEVLGNSRSRADFIDRCGTNLEEMLESLSTLGETAPGTPIIVVDQAEELYTLRDADRRSAPVSSSHSASSRPDEDLTTARVNYMNLLRAATAKPLGVKFLISLRTEYKGLFEDELRGEMKPEDGSRLTGFHLDDLDKKGLVTAIESPTRLGASDGRCGVYRFRYANGVADRIADRLSDAEAVPMGGVLPTLQVVCSRLYEQTKRSKGRVTGEWKIEMTDLERLGNLDNQVEVYLRERLEEMFVTRADTPTSPSSNMTSTSGSGEGKTDRTEQIDQWYRLLEKLVRVQGDGRAVTRQLPREQLDQHVQDLECETFLGKALGYLASEKVGILRSEDREGKQLWTLGHDSLGLAIQKWSVTYKETLNPIMQMDMNSPRAAAKLTGSQLFPEGEEPAPFIVIMPRDLLWDHQLPSFAGARNFSSRLGIQLVPHRELEVCNSEPSETIQYPVHAHPSEELRDRIVKYSRENKRSRVLVAAERAAFPPDNAANEWTDIAVSDLFVGNGLVGPVIEGLSPLRPVEITDKSKRMIEMRFRLGRIIRHLTEQRATLLSYDSSAEKMMELGASLAGESIVKGSLVFSYKGNQNRRYRANDELFDWLAEYQQDPSVFMVGTAYGRALAIHRGYRTYFDCKDLDELIKELSSTQQGEANHDGVDGASHFKLSRLYRESFFHTLWQINIPATEWRRIEHYPLVMRLAAVCYFTADYIRAFADDFVRHLYDWHANNFDETDRVSRETMREVLHYCFQFLTFEENPRLLFDPDSRLEFKPRDGGGNPLPSTVRDIHVELTALRKRTVDLFGEMCGQLDQLERYPADVNRESREILQGAERLRGAAWENFRIYNYYDSARLMRRALELVGEVVNDTTKRVWSRQTV